MDGEEACSSQKMTEPPTPNIEAWEGSRFVEEDGEPGVLVGHLNGVVLQATRSRCHGKSWIGDTAWEVSVYRAYLLSTVTYEMRIEGLGEEG